MVASYETTEKQRQQLLQDGFVLLESAIGSDQLAQWQSIAEELEANALAAHSEGSHLHGACVIDSSVGPRLTRFDDILETHTDAALDLLSSPGMMAVARDLCGRGVVPLQMDILFKHQHPHSEIKWHQGPTHPRGFPYLNVGIYLDDADADDGCLKYIPGSQSELHDICELSETHGWQIPGVVEQPAKAGDILVQDMMILHGSAPKRSAGVRRTVYVEFRPAAGITESGRQSERWIDLRKQWMATIVRRANAEEWPSDWEGDLPLDLGTDEEIISAISATREPPLPAVYCPRDIETDDYPIPADMRVPG